MSRDSNERDPVRPRLLRRLGQAAVSPLRLFAMARTNETASEYHKGDKAGTSGGSEKGVSQQVVGDVLRLAQRGDGSLEVSRVPKDDGGDEEVEAGRAVLLVFIGAIADFTEPVDEGARPRQAVAGFALVELGWLLLCHRSGSSIQSRVNRVRSSRPSSRSAAATPFCLG